jgi:hypothetical protein
LIPAISAIVATATAKIAERGSLKVRLAFAGWQRAAFQHREVDAAG